jgi:hypothetical protein
MRRIVVYLTILTALSASAATAQTCGGLLSCNTGSVGYEVANAGTGVAFEGINTNTTTSSATVGVWGQEKANTTGSAGVLGDDGSACSASNLSLSSAGVDGGSVGGYGVIGFTATGGAGVAGYNWETSQCLGSAAVAGFLGYKNGSNSYGVYANGNIGATGTKSFIEPHPTDASKEIRYVSLEGPEAGTYFRGTGRTANGFATVEVPESFRMVTAEQGLTVVVTAHGELAQIACISKSLDKIVIQSSKDVAFDYVVNGVRKAFKDFQPIAENDDFVPQGPNDNLFFTLPVESQRRLVATGVYTPDGKVNLDKAREMGWDRQWAQQKAVKDFLAFAAAQHR